jgi:hypothetical protein
VDRLHMGVRHRVLLMGDLLFQHRPRFLHRLFLRVLLFRPDADCERKGTSYQYCNEFYHAGSSVNLICLVSPTVCFAASVLLISSIIATSPRSARCLALEQRPEEEYSPK